MDRVIASAVKQALDPYFQRVFLGKSFGFRPRLSPWSLLAVLEVMVSGHERFVIANHDVRKAFDNVPIDPLMEQHSRHIREQALMDLLESVFRGDNPERRIGIAQGNPYSPTALNLFLHNLHDSALEQDHNFPFWLRYADNIIYPCQNVPQGREITLLCQNLLSEGDLCLKNTEDENQTLIDLKAGKEVNLLGYQLSLDQRDNIQYGMSTEAWNKLQENLTKAHQQDNPPEAAQQCIMGWINWCGPAYAIRAERHFLQQIQFMAKKLGFDELNVDKVKSTWKYSWENWTGLRRKVWQAHTRYGSLENVTAAACHAEPGSPE